MIFEKKNTQPLQFYSFHSFTVYAVLDPVAYNHYYSNQIVFDLLIKKEFIVIKMIFNTLLKHGLLVPSSLIVRGLHM